MILPEIMSDSIKYLEENKFILGNPTAKSIELRNIAVEYAKEIANINSKIVVIALTGSSIGGYSGMGSDIDLDVLIDGRTRSIKKIIYKGIPIDLQYKSFKDWKDDCINGGESVRYLTHTVAIYDKTGEFLSFQKEILKKHCSDDSIKCEYERIKNIVERRGSLGVEEAKLGQLIPSAIRLESVIYETISLLIYRYKGYTATSLILPELHRIGAKLGHSDWFDKAVKYLRFDITKDEYYELLSVYDELFKMMRDRISNNMDIVKRIKKMKLGLFGAGNQLIELCSQTNYQQLYDKVERAIIKGKESDAGLSLWYEAHYQYFLFAAFFYLKNINRKASGKMISDTSFNDLFNCWDNDIKELWLKVYRASGLSQGALISMNNLAYEILLYCE